jgi:hypothetical protein
MEKRKFFIQLSSGDKFEISELDYNNVQGRIVTGRSNGWYVQRGESIGARHNWAIQFKDVSGIWSDQDKRERVKMVRDIDIEKRLPPEVGQLEEVKDGDCHDWNNPDTWEFKKQSVNGADRYFKVCKTCGAKSVIIKKREVEVFMTAQDKTLNDIVNI